MEVVDVRRAYFFAEEKRDTFVELPDCVLAEFWTDNARWKAAQGVARNPPSGSIMGR